MEKLTPDDVGRIAADAWKQYRREVSKKFQDTIEMSTDEQRFFENALRMFASAAKLVDVKELDKFSESFKQHAAH